MGVQGVRIRICVRKGISLSGKYLHFNLVSDRPQIGCGSEYVPWTIETMHCE